MTSVSRSTVKCPRCGRPANRLVRCGVCDDRVCPEECLVAEEGACKNCVTLGVGEPSGEDGSDE